MSGWCRALGGGWPRANLSADPGRVRLYLQSVADGEIIHSMLHGRGSQVGCNLLSVSVRMRATAWNNICLPKKGSGVSHVGGHRLN